MKCNRLKKNSNPVDKLFRYLKFRLSTIGVKVTYSTLLLFYAYNRSETPKWAKNIILGSFAYFVNPFDSIPDLTPFLGMTDDMGVLLFGLSTIACYINEEVRQKALMKLTSIVKTEIDLDSLEEIDAWL